MDERQIFSGSVARIDDTAIVLKSIWRETVLVSLIPDAGGRSQVWLRQGEFVEIAGRRWLMIDLQRGTDEGARSVMVQLVAVE